MANTLKFGNGQWATGNGTALAYNDENSNFKPLPFDFTRASSGTTVNQSGLIETVGSGLPRIDFQGNTKGALLLEPQRTNYIPYSTLDFNGGVKPNGWSVGFGTGSYSYEQLTYKGQKAVKQTQITTGRSYLDTSTITILANTEHTLKIQFILDECVADANDDIIVILGFGVNIIYQFSDIDENGVLEFQYNPLSDNTGNIRIGLGCNGNEDGGKSLAWAIPQLEAGSYATSYIPTSGSAVTRVADVCSQTPPSGVIGQTEGVLYAEISALTNNPPFSPISLSNNNTNNRILIYLQDTRIRVLCQFNNIAFFAFNYTVSDVSNLHKIALKYKSGESALWVNGTYIAGSSTTTNGASSDMLIFRLGNSTGTVFFEGNCKDIRVYNTALTDAQLKALTT